LQRSLSVLNALQAALDYLPVTTPILRQAALLWAEARRQGIPTADRHALDGDVILAATARVPVGDGHDAIVATTNVGHLSRFIPAQLWQDIL
jgi:predicted nucleic acid-binding protein